MSFSTSKSIHRKTAQVEQAAAAAEKSHVVLVIMMEILTSKNDAIGPNKFVYTGCTYYMYVVRTAMILIRVSDRQ